MKFARLVERKTMGKPRKEEVHLLVVDGLVGEDLVPVVRKNLSGLRGMDRERAIGTNNVGELQGGRFRRP